MMRLILTLILGVFFHFLSLSQIIVFGNETTLTIKDKTIFFGGGDVTFNGSVINDGTISSYSDIDFKSNKEVGNLNFVGIENQTLSGDTISANNVKIDKSGSLELDSKQLIVIDTLEMTTGTLNTNEDTDFLLLGNSKEGFGYINGDFLSITKDDPLVLPTGVNGVSNYVTISNTNSGTIIKAKCQTPEPNQLKPNEDIVGIADEAEWMLSTIEDSTSATISISFNGLDLFNFSNGKEIRSLAYGPAIAILRDGDSTYLPLTTLEVLNFDDNDRSSGVVISSDEIIIGKEITRLSISWIPIQVAPTFFVPNAFAPYGNEPENRFFRTYFVGALINEFSLSIFDSFNNEIYSVSESGDELDITNLGWSGKLNSGSDAPEGVYYYSTRIVAEGETYNKTGSVLLVK